MSLAASLGELDTQLSDLRSKREQLAMAFTVSESSLFETSAGEESQQYATESTPVQPPQLPKQVPVPRGSTEGDASDKLRTYRQFKVSRGPKPVGRDLDILAHPNIQLRRDTEGWSDESSGEPSSVASGGRMASTSKGVRKTLKHRKRRSHQIVSEQNSSGSSQPPRDEGGDGHVQAQSSLQQLEALVGYLGTATEKVVAAGHRVGGLTTQARKSIDYQQNRSATRRGTVRTRSPSGRGDPEAGRTPQGRKGRWHRALGSLTTPRSRAGPALGSLLGSTRGSHRAPASPAPWAHTAHVLAAVRSSVAAAADRIVAAVQQLDRDVRVRESALETRAARAAVRVAASTGAAGGLWRQPGRAGLSAGRKRRTRRLKPAVARSRTGVSSRAKAGGRSGPGPRLHSGVRRVRSVGRKGRAIGSRRLRRRRRKGGKPGRGGAGPSKAVGLQAPPDWLPSAAAGEGGQEGGYYLIPGAALWGAASDEDLEGRQEGGAGSVQHEDAAEGAGVRAPPGEGSVTPTYRAAADARWRAAVDAPSGTHVLRPWARQAPLSPPLRAVRARLGGARLDGAKHRRRAGEAARREQAAAGEAARQAASHAAAADYLRGEVEAAKGRAAGAEGRLRLHERRADAAVAQAARLVADEGEVSGVGRAPDGRGGGSVGVRLLGLAVKRGGRAGSRSKGRRKAGGRAPGQRRLGSGSAGGMYLHGIVRPVMSRSAGALR